MLAKLKGLPEIRSAFGRKVIELELEETIDVSGIDTARDNIVFVGRFCDSIVVCVGKIVNYEVVTPEYAKLDIKGRSVSFSISV